MPKSQEMLMMQDVWRKAWTKPDGLTIKFKSNSGAVRARMQLYNAVKTVKAGSDEFADQVLRNAANGIEIVWVDDLTIRLQKRSESDMMQGIQAVLGKTAEDYEDPEIAESSRKLLEQLAAVGITMTKEKAVKKPDPELPQLGEHQENPFFAKRG